MSWSRSQESQNKMHNTMNEKYGGYTLESAVLRSAMCDTMVKRYNADNPMKIPEFQKKAKSTKDEIWKETIFKEFPMKSSATRDRYNCNVLNEDEMTVYLLSERISRIFLSENGHRLKPKWGKYHNSVALVKDDTVYQVLRFEKHNHGVILADFGDKEGFFNPNQYTKLLDFAFQILGLDDFFISIPRSLATLSLTYSLSVEFVSEGLYEVFWVLGDNSLKKLTRWDNIAEMKQKYDYVTSDFLDLYRYKRQAGRHFSLLDEFDLNCV